MRHCEATRHAELLSKQGGARIYANAERMVAIVPEAYMGDAASARGAGGGGASVQRVDVQ